VILFETYKILTGKDKINSEQLLQQAQQLSIWEGIVSNFTRKALDWT